MNRIEKNIKWIILIILCIIFMFFLPYAFEVEIMNFDKVFHKYLIEYGRNDIIIDIMRYITWFANPIGLVIVTLITMISFNNRKHNIRLIFNLGFVLALNQILKFIIQRERPVGYSLINESGYSFPSGHSMLSLAFYGYLIYLIWKSNKSNITKWLFSASLSVLIFMIGISRIYLGVHYASDVFAGMCLSLGYLIVYATILDKIDSKKGE